MRPKTPGQIAYEGYCGETGGKSLISGSPLPPFERLAEPIQDAWEAAARALLAAERQGGFHAVE